MRQRQAVTMKKALAYQPIVRMNAGFKRAQPAAQSRQILALTGQLETLALAKKPATVKPPLRRTCAR